jgi:tRNA threonylcarbamoyladenosine biosynthesis protein TsaB
MRILALDTTSNFGSIALHENGAVVEELSLHSTDGFSQVLFDHLKRLLDRHEWDLASIGCFAAANGPGSFTGVRVGLAAVKGLAEATGAAAIAVSNLKALAVYGTTSRRAVIIDARRGEVYAAVYDADLKAVTPEVVMPAAEWISSLQVLPSEIISTDLLAFRGLFGSDIPASEHRSLAAAIARVAESDLAGGSTGDALLLDANYVRRSDAELFWRER